MERRIDVVVYKWDSTAENHAGMFYLAKHIVAKNNNSQLCEEYRYENWVHGLKQKIKKALWAAKFILKRVYIKNSSEHVILFMEYFGNSWQIYLASFLRFLHPKLKIYSIIHLPYTILIDVHKPYNIVKYTNYCNKVFVFGSSLKRDLINGGCTAEIVLSHHYVDVNYYKPGLKTYSTPKPTIIIMGDMMRNKELILDILCHLQYLDLQVIYCGGRSGVPARIKEFKNIESYEYLSEDSLLKLMQKSDISLNVFNDTIGSNVIVTSMAVGLAIVASNVGSITDYCDNDNAILCPNDTRAFVHAIDTLIGDVDLLKKKQEASLLKAKMYSVENSISSFFK